MIPFMWSSAAEQNLSLFGHLIGDAREKTMRSHRATFRPLYRVRDHLELEDVVLLERNRSAWNTRG